jgi:prophage regulatory protein
MQAQNTPPTAQLLRLPAVLERTGLSRSSIYRAEANGTFPKHIKLGERASAWLASDVERWIAQRVAASRKEAA